MKLYELNYVWPLGISLCIQIMNDSSILIMASNDMIYVIKSTDFWNIFKENLSLCFKQLQNKA